MATPNAVDSVASMRIERAPVRTRLLPSSTALAPSDQASGLFAAISALLGFLFAFNAMLLTAPAVARWIAPAQASTAVLPLRVLLVAVAVTALMTWLVMPHAARLLQNWLYAPTRR